MFVPFLAKFGAKFLIRVILEKEIYSKPKLLNHFLSFPYDNELLLNL